MFDKNFIDRLAQSLAARIAQLLGMVPPGGQKGEPPWLKDMKHPNPKRLLNIKECAAYIGRSETAVYRLVGRRQIPVVRNGRTLRFDRIELDRWVEGDKKI